MKKLVRINPVTGRYIDIDRKRLALEAAELEKYILDEIDPKDDKNGIIKKLLPMCEKAKRLEYTEALGREDLPLKYQLREGLLPNDLDRLFSKFAATITGTPIESISIIDVGGEPHAEIEFLD